MASEPPMDLRMAATASACASVFSPVASSSPAMKGSANVRARASALACCGIACSVAAISSGSGEGSACSAVRLFMGSRSEQERGHGLDLVVLYERGCMPHAFEFDDARTRAALGHGLRGSRRQHVGIGTARDEG